MPKDGIVTAEEITKGDKDFDDVFDNIIDKTDEELQSEAATQAESDAASGDAQKDQTTDDDSTKKPTEDSTNKQDPDPVDDDTSGLSQSDWKAKAEELEAELKKERQRTSSWDGRIKAANKKAKELEAEVKILRSKLDEKQTSQQAEEEQSDQEVMDKFKETFPELVDVISIMEKKINRTDTSHQDKAQDESDTTEDDLDPEPASSDDSSSDHEPAICDMAAVRRAHPDVDEAVSSGVIETWVNSQADYIRPALEKVYYGKDGFGNTKQVIDLMQNFKKSTGWESSLKKSTDNKSDKLNSMKESEGDSGGPVDRTGPDTTDFDAGAKDAGL